MRTLSKLWMLLAVLSLVFMFSAHAETELTLGVRASSSSYNSSPNRAVDDNLSTYWEGSWWSGFWWLRLDCGQSYPLTQISIWWHSSYGARNYDIQVSSNGNNWTDVYTDLNSTTEGSNPTYSLSTTARYVRIFINKPQRQYPRVYEVKLYTGGAANQAPTASASATPTSGNAPLTVSFTGSGNDPDGTIAGYSWTFGDGATSTVQNPSHTYASAGNYTATLTVTDNDGATGSDTVTITVSSPNQSPTASASANPTSGDAPLDVYFTGSGNDPDGTIASYSWDFGDTTTSSEQNPTHTYTNPGTYVATLTVTDNDGMTGSADVVIMAQVPFVAPWQIPHLLRFQGRIADSGGQALDGDYDMTFRLYDAETQGNMLWSETQSGVSVTQGVFSVLLGSVTPLDLRFDQDYWLSTEVGSDGEMSPRQRITSVGYSYRAENVNKDALAYTGHGRVQIDLTETLYFHLEAVPKSIKLYLWGEQDWDNQTIPPDYPNNLTIELNGEDKTESLLAQANLNWNTQEAALGDGSANHPLVTGAYGVSGTGSLELLSLGNWSAGEQKIEFSQTGSGSGRIRYNLYIRY